MEVKEKFYRFHYLNCLTGETGHSVSKIPESDRDIWFQHLNRADTPLAYWAEEIREETGIPQIEACNSNKNMLQ